MTTGEAIKNLNVIATATMPGKSERFNDALQLGIEALKRCRESQEYSHFHTYKLLPGETKD